MLLSVFFMAKLLRLSKIESKILKIMLPVFAYRLNHRPTSIVRATTVFTLSWNLNYRILEYINYAITLNHEADLNKKFITNVQNFTTVPLKKWQKILPLLDNHLFHPNILPFRNAFSCFHTFSLTLALSPCMGVCVFIYFKSEPSKRAHIFIFLTC
jgi:hypothetical protein